MKRFQRVISFTLCVIMVFQMIPQTFLAKVFAAGPDASGKCGENLTWVLDEGILTISGTGPMTDFWAPDYEPTPEESANPKFSPFTELEGLLLPEKMIVEEGVTSIGDHAFNGGYSNYGGPKTVELPSTLTKVGQYAFYYARLESVELPEGLTQLGESAFEFSLVSKVTIPSTLKEIPKNAFYCCRRLENLTISSGVETIGEMAFADCANVPLNGEAFEPWNMKGLREVTIPSSVKTVGPYAFSGNCLLEEVVMNEGLETISEGAFSDCGFLLEIHIPSTVKSIGLGAFYCQRRYPADLSYPDNFPNDYPGGPNHIYIYSDDVAIALPDSLVSGQYPITRDNTIILGREGSSAESYVDQFNILYLGNTDWTGYTYGKQSFQALSSSGHNFRIWEITEDGTHRRVCDRSCGDVYCNVVEEYAHSANLVDLESFVVMTCESDGYQKMICSACGYEEEIIVKADHVLSGLVSDGISHWRECLHCGEKTGLAAHDWEAVEGTSTYKCTVCGKTDSVSESGSIGSNLWYKMLSGYTLIIGGEGEMADYSGGKYTEDESDDWTEEDKLANPNPLESCAVAEALYFENGVTSISHEMFYSWNFLQWVTFPSTLKSIGIRAFADCTALREVHLPEGLAEMGFDAFSFCINLSSVYIPSTLKVVPEGAFSDAHMLTDLTISEGVERIENRGFRWCSNLHYGHYDTGLMGLEDLNLPSTLKYIGEEAFFQCVMVDGLVLPEGLTYIGSRAFFNLPFVREVIIPSTVEFIGAEAFCVQALDISEDAIPMFFQQPAGLANIYILSRDVELDFMDEQEEGNYLYNIVNIETLVHGYENSTAQDFVKTVNTVEWYDRWEESDTEMIFIPFADGEHNFGERTSVDEHEHHRVCTDPDCDVEEVAPHTLRIDYETMIKRTCTTDGQYRWKCTACDYAEEYIYEFALGHDVEDFIANQDEEYHYRYCYECWEEIPEAHEWEYKKDNLATEPYQVDAKCKICGYKTVITIVPDNFISLNLIIKKQNGTTEPLELGYQIQWIDRDNHPLTDDAGNAITGTLYQHSANWEVSEEFPIRAILSFNDELCEAYVVPETVEYVFTELGQYRTSILTERPKLNITGKVLTEGAKVEVTTTLAGVDTTLQVKLNQYDSFYESILRAPTTVTVSAHNHYPQVFKDVQMMAQDESGYINLGTIELEEINNMETEFLTVAYEKGTSQYEIAKRMTNATSFVLRNLDTGAVYSNVRFVYRDEDQATDGSGSYTLRMRLGQDCTDYFWPGDEVQLEFPSGYAYGMHPYTFYIPKDGMAGIGYKLPLNLQFYNTVSVNLPNAYCYVFDSDNNLVAVRTNGSRTVDLPVGSYTLVAFQKNAYFSSISSVNELEEMGIPAQYYLKHEFTVNAIDETVKLTGLNVPTVNMYNGTGIMAEIAQSAKLNEYLPLVIKYNSLATQEEIDTYGGLVIRVRVNSSHPVSTFKEVDGVHAFTGDEGLSIETDAGTEDTFYPYVDVRVNKPQGEFTLYVKPVGGTLDVKVQGNQKAGGYANLYLFSNTVEMTLPSVVHEPTGTIHLYTLLSPGSYWAKTYINGELYSENVVSTYGNGENVLPYQLKEYADGISSQSIQVVVYNKYTDETIWDSGERVITLLPSETYPKPYMLDIRHHIDYSSENSGHSAHYLTEKKTGSHSIQFHPDIINPDGNTIMRDLVIDYKLTMLNPEHVVDGELLLKVFCGETLPEPTIHTIRMKWNKETKTFDGTLSFEADEYSFWDMPYGYSYVYASDAVMEEEISYKAIEDALQGEWDSIKSRGGWEPAERIDMDALEFELQNTELTEDEKQLFRTLAVMDNRLTDLSNEIPGLLEEGIFDTADIFDINSSDLNTLEGKQRLFEELGLMQNVEAISGVTEDDLLEMGYYPITVDGKKVYILIDKTSEYVSVVNLEDGIHSWQSDAIQTFAAESGGSVASIGQAEATACLYITKILEGIYFVLYAFQNAVANTRIELDKDIESLTSTIEKLTGEAIDKTPSIQQLEKAIQKIKAKYPNKSTEQLERFGSYIRKKEALDNLNQEIKAAMEALKIAKTQSKHAKTLRDALKTTVNACEKVSLGISKFMSGPWGTAFGWLTDILNLIFDAVGVFSEICNVLERIDNIAMRQKWADGEKEKGYEKTHPYCELSEEEAAEAKKEWVECQVAHRAHYDEAEALKIKLWLKVGHKALVLLTDVISIVTTLVKTYPVFAMALDLNTYIWSHNAGLVADWIVGDGEVDLDALETDLVNECTNVRKFTGKCDDGGGSDSNDGDGDNDGNDGNGGNGGSGGSGGSGGGGGGGSGVETNLGFDPMVDPAGFVYEAVASNRIEGAVAKVYYKGEDGSEIYWSQAPEYDQINPQITDENGRFSWMTPFGDWLVKVEKDGYLPADSKDDPAAVDGWLPVPPPQMNVNIGMISTAAPTVKLVSVGADQVQIIFSQYMDIAQFESESLVMVQQNGTEISMILTFTDAEESPTEEGVFYGRILKLTPANGEHLAGNGFAVEVKGSAKNYAGTTIGTDYKTENLAVVQILGSLSHTYPNRYVTDVSKVEQIVVVALDTLGHPMSGVTVTSGQQLGGTLEITESVVTDENGRAVFSFKGISSGYDIVTFSSGNVSVDMNTRVSPVGTVAPSKPTANLTDYQTVDAGTQLILECATEGATIYYTTDDTCPCEDGPGRKVYTGPITINEDTLFRIASWTQAGGYSERLNLRIRVNEPAHTHSLSKIPATPATCTADGKESYYTCSCGKYFADEAGSQEIKDLNAYGVIPALSHDEITHVAKAPTCTEIGWDAYVTCSRCDYTTYVEIPENGHDFDTSKWNPGDRIGHWHDCKNCEAHDTPADHVPNIGAATEEYDKYCVLCGFIIDPKLSHVHTMALTEKVEATCEEDGKEAYYTCTGSCGKHFVDEKGTQEIADLDSYGIIPALDHAWDNGVITTNPDCTKEGVKTFTCQNDGKHTYTEPVAALGHDKITHVAKAPTCTEIGWDAYVTCSRCDYTTYVEIPENGHDFDTSKWNPGNSTGHWHDCKNCDAHDTPADHVPNIGAATEEYDKYCVLCGFIIDPKLSHVHTMVLTAKVEATCEEDGKEAYYTCSGSCGKRFVDEQGTQEITDLASYGIIPAMGHAWDNGVITTNPDCTKAGEKTFTCQNDRKHTYTEPVSALGHDEIRHDAKAPTCTEIGWDAYVTCSRCDYTTYVEIPENGHDFDTSKWNPGDRTGHWHDCKNCDAHDTPADHVPNIGAATEEYDKYCVLCGFIIDPKLSHVHTMVLTAKVEATCEEDGKEAYYTCTGSCGKHFVDEKGTQEIADLDSFGIIPATDHTWDAGVVTTNPTCTAKGIKTFTCQNDSDHTYTVDVDALDHDLIHHDAQVPDCDKVGWDAYDTCSRCDYSTYAEIPALGHNAVTDKGYAATCTETGLTDGSHCDRCDEVLTEQKEIPALGHDWDDGVVTVEPDCENPGEKVYTCGNDNTHTRTETIPALGHHYTDGTCIECGISDPNYVPPTEPSKPEKPSRPSWGNIWDWLFGKWWNKGCEHSYTTEVTSATCTERGYTTHTCTECGDSYRDSYTSALGHDWDAGEVTKQATCTKNGEITHTCDTCGAWKKEMIQAPGHRFENGVCSECGEEKHQEKPSKPVKPGFGWFFELIFGWWT